MTAVKWHYDYDGAKRLLEATWDEGNNGSVETTYTYTYDDAGNRESKTIVGVETKVTTYRYNSLGQLYQATTGGVVTTYQYDIYGNQTAQLKDGVLEYAYSWSISNEMTSAKIYDTDGTTVVKTIAFGYDEKGTRVSRQETGGDPMRYLTDHRSPTGYSQVLAELDNSATQVSGNEYTYGDSLISQSGTGVSHFFHGDHLGSTRLLTDGSGSLIPNSNYDYSPYGVPLTHADSSLTSYRYTGQYLEPSLGLQYHRARWLKLATGNWLSVDPVFDFYGNFGSLHGYVGGNVVNAVDQNGKWTMVETVGVAGWVAELTSFSLPSLAILGLKIGAIYYLANEIINKLTIMFHVCDENLLKIAMLNRPPGALTVAGTNQRIYWSPFNPADYRTYMGLMLHTTQVIAKIVIGIRYRRAAERFCGDMGIPFESLPENLKVPSRKPVFIVSAPVTSPAARYFGGGLRVYRNSWLMFNFDNSVYSTQQVLPTHYRNLGFMGIGSFVAKIQKLL